jgi:hypothetical protein
MVETGNVTQQPWPKVKPLGKQLGKILRRRNEDSIRNPMGCLGYNLMAGFKFAVFETLNLGSSP